MENVEKARMKASAVLCLAEEEEVSVLPAAIVLLVCRYS